MEKIEEESTHSNFHILSIKNSNEIQNPDPNQNIINEEAKKYFTIDIKEENPIILDKWTNIRYYNLELIFNSFYPLTSLGIAKNASKEERIAKKIKDNSFTYGEITFKSMAYIFEYIRSIVGKDYFTKKLHDNEAGIFYDLGSGTGKAVIAMALLCPLKKLVGIELLKGLWDLSMRSRFAYYQNISNKFMKFNDIFSIERTNEIEFYNGDFMRQKWTDAAIVFANSTCFSDDLMFKIGIKAMFECKVDCILITISKKLKNLNDDWECKEDFKRMMSWGLGSVYIYIRRKITVIKGEHKLID